MIILKNGCTYSGLTVTPSNWKTSKADINDVWYVSYRFYDPNYPEPKHKKIKGGINKFKTLVERQVAVKAILDTEKDLIEIQGYNPFLNTRVFATSNGNYIIDPNTPIIKALREAHKRLEKAKITMDAIKYVIDGIEKAASYCQMTAFPINTIKRRHIITLLDTCAQINKKWSNNRHNKYKAYLGMLFSELVKVEAIEDSPMTKIEKKVITKRFRKTLTISERKTIDNFLRTNHYNFWRFLHIFFHSGARESEMMLVKKENINLTDRTFVVIVLKGKTPKEVKKPINNLVLDLWEKLYSSAKPNDYIFSKDLIPGENSISPRQITRRWKEHVKKKLNIQADFYSLKHSNLDEITDLSSMQDAAKIASHTSIKMIKENYAIGEEERQLERLRNIENPFVNSSSEV